MPLIILDRDGVINFDSDHFIKNANEWLPIPGSLEAIARLKRSGYTVAVASNQSGLARGLFTQDDLDGIHRKFNAALASIGGSIDGVFFCPHGPDDGCDCRKPKPGLLYQISTELDVALDSAIMIGDSKRDLDAAISAGCRAILVRTGKDTQSIERDPSYRGVSVYDNLSEAVDEILSC